MVPNSAREKSIRFGPRCQGCNLFSACLCILSYLIPNADEDPDFCATSSDQLERLTTPRGTAEASGTATHAVLHLAETRQSADARLELSTGLGEARTTLVRAYVRHPLLLSMHTPCDDGLVLRGLSRDGMFKMIPRTARTMHCHPKLSGRAM